MENAFHELINIVITPNFQIVVKTQDCINFNCFLNSLMTNFLEISFFYLIDTNYFVIFIKFVINFVEKAIVVIAIDLDYFLIFLEKIIFRKFIDFSSLIRQARFA